MVQLGKLKQAFFVLVFLFYFILMWSFISDIFFFRGLLSFSYSNLIYALVFWLFSYLLFVFKWRYVFALKGIKLRFKECLLYQFVELAFFFMPFKSNMVAICLILKKKYSLKFHKTFPIKLFISLVDLSAITLLSLYSLFSFFKQYALHYVFLIIVIISIVFFLSSKKPLEFILKVFNTRILNKYKSYFKEGVEDIKSSFKLNLIIRVFFLTLIPWVIEGAVLFFLIRFFNFQLSFLTAVSIYSFSILIALVSTIPGGVGITEGSLTYLLFLTGIPLKASISIALLSRLILAIIPAIIGTLVLFIKGKQLLDRKSVFLSNR